MRLSLVLGSALVPFAIPATAAEFEFKPNDRLVLIGATMIEREQRYGYWESVLTLKVPGLKVRNLGWSGDDVFGTARRAFDLDKPDIGRKRLIDLTLAEKPTVIAVCYGANESFEGEAGLKNFANGYRALLDGLAPAKARIVVVCPPAFEEMPPPLPDMSKANANLNVYRGAIRSICRTRKLPFIDLDEAFGGLSGMKGMTDDGIHLTADGYSRSARSFAKAFGINPDDVSGTDIEHIRPAIQKKNRLYFYRWRPQNETYLFGFRKHEQGKNAKEVAEFDPLVAEAEAEIEKLLKKNN
jgi:lysophospholipase L1-like esterase